MDERAPNAVRMQKLLIANRGEIVGRVARTAHAMGLATVAVYSDVDRDALHVVTCDEAVAVGGASPAESYLRIDALLAAADRTGADAVHPGYGFLSENATFAAAVVAAGLCWVGPSPEAIGLMGDKLVAKSLMAAAGVPVAPSAEVGPDTDLNAVGHRVGLPLLVKAAAGGGGKGMRLVESLDDLPNAVSSCRREAGAAFGDDRVFLERFILEPRHIEVQVVGDQFGEVVHLFERECSVQRRHQKVIEEAPAHIDEELRRRLCDAAVVAARTIQYSSTGTVEFVVGRDGTLAFLEMNTRLQVEHPVTEATTGLDLVRLQLEVADGMRLSVRQEEIVRHGHAIEARLYAEDPGNGYLPAPGELFDLRPSRAGAVRWDLGIKAPAAISPFYDPMIAKVIGYGETRDEAVAVLRRSLAATHIHGVTTNRDLLVAVLGDPRFQAGDVTTELLPELYPTDADRKFVPTPALVRQAAVVATVAGTQEHPAYGSPLLGFRNNPSQDQVIRFDGPESEVAVGYRIQRDGSWAIRAADRSSTARVLEIADGVMSMELDGLRFTALFSRASTEAGFSWEITIPGGHVGLFEAPRFPRAAAEEIQGATRAPMPGVVVAVHVAEGDLVQAGALVCVVEAMKMEHQITAPEHGRVTSLAAVVGDQVDANQVLVVIEAQAADADT